MISSITEGCLLDATIVVTPAPVAISAAISFVSIPPVPRLDPSVDVLTKKEVSQRLSAVPLDSYLWPERQQQK